MEYKVKQIWPNHADHISYYKEKYLQQMFGAESVVIQPKYDGERMLLHFVDGEFYCTSRRFSKKTGRFMENQDKLPKLKVVAEKLKDLGIGYTVLDCECYAKNWSESASVLKSLPERAIELQNAIDIKFAVFDCLIYNGIERFGCSYAYRIEEAERLVRIIDADFIHNVGSYDYDRLFTPYATERNFIVYDFNVIQAYMQKAIDDGFEGIVIKSLYRKYYDKAAVLKVKKFETVDCVVCGYQQGRNKYSDTIGALEIGYYDPEQNSVIKISKVNCSTDKERDYWRDHWDELVNSVIEVKCQEITNRSLRHPVYIRRRHDKDYTMCTRDTIFKEEEE